MIEHRASRVGWRVLLGLFAGASMIFAAQDPGMVLSSPVVSGNGFNFTLNAESGVSYTIEASSNLLDWVAVDTNTGPGILRFITITNPPADLGYFRAARAPLPLFGGGITAKGKIQMSGGAYLDSYDSANGPYSAGTARSNAVALTDSANFGAISLSGGYIAGVAATGPGGTITLSGSATIKGSTRNDANIQIDDVTAPVFSTYSTTLPAGQVNGTNYNFVATTGNYQVSTLNIGSGKMVVNGDAVVYVTYTGNNAVVVSGSGFIYITPGSSLTIYSAGNMVMSGGGIVNGNQDASKLTIYGLPTCTQIIYSGSANFYGVVNAPEAAFTLSSPVAAAFGAFIVNSANLIGGGVHYDEHLARGGPTR
ncbi:MAG TPA: hypothetical protein VNN22_11615 [Verrucomicrobiae bacterium]|nr:hypothetical protein [Verrucomicrobiae bacterium]